MDEKLVNFIYPTVVFVDKDLVTREAGEFHVCSPWWPRLDSSFFFNANQDLEFIIL